MRTKRITAVFMAAAVLGLSGCSHTATVRRSPRTRIVYSWCGDDEVNSSSLMGIDAFNESTGLYVVPEYCEPKIYKEKLGSQMAAEKQADVMQISYDKLFQYSGKDDKFYNIYDLSDKIDFSTYPDGALLCGVRGGRLYGIPYNFDALTFVYDKSMFDKYGLEIPETWDDLFAAAEIMSKDDVYPLSLSNEGLWLCCCAYFEQTTGKKISKSPAINLNAQDYEVMINFYQKLISSKVTKSGIFYDSGDLERGTVCGAACWASEAGYFDDAGEKLHDEIVIGKPPRTEKPLCTGWYRKPSGFYAISRTTDNPNEAAEFLNYLINSPDMAVFTGLSKGVPVSRAALETLEARDMLGGLEYDASKQADSLSLEMMSPYFEDEQIIDEFISICENVRYSKSSASSAAYSAEKHINKVIAELPG